MKEMIKEIIREEMSRLNKNFYFMAGLPRSGSTLLSSILNQNPRFLFWSKFSSCCNNDCIRESVFQR